MEAYLWMVKGFGGLVKTLEEMSEAREKMPEHVRNELQNWLERLRRVIDIQNRLGDECP